MQYIQWEYATESFSVEVVVPDGCQDILIVESDHNEPQVRITHWDDQTRRVTIEERTKISGFRLRPGASFDYSKIVDLEANIDQAKMFIDDAVSVSSEATEWIAALNDYQSSISTVCKQMGVGVRTLQRRFRKLGLPSPEYWRLLSRARTAATALPERVSLADIAHTYGYSDQPHMTREFIRWFGATPLQIRKNHKLLSEISQPGLGNWTLEQISIR